MTEIEEKFFKNFDIKPKWKDKRVKYAKTYYTEEQAKYLRRTTKNRNIQLVYPPITDRILLELICILNQYYCNNYQCATMLVGSSVEEVKRCVLVECLENANHIKTEIRALFEEGAEE